MPKKVKLVAKGGVSRVEKIPEIGIGMLGYAFMGKAHNNAYKKIPYIFWPPAAIPKLIAICGRFQEKVREAAQRYGYEKYYTKWEEMLKDNQIQIFDNNGPNNLHMDPCIVAAQAGKHVICEKPLARNAAEAKRMLEVVKKAGVKHMCAFNYRFVPAIKLAKDLIDKGIIGRVYHYRARYLQEWILNPEFPLVWRLDKERAGSGALGDLGSHIIDLARFLIGEPRYVSAVTTTFIKKRPLPEEKNKVSKVTVDDAFEAIIEFQNGAVGTLEASRLCPGRKNYEVFEINGSKGSISFNLERLNELDVYLQENWLKEVRGYHNALVTESYHPFYEKWWPPGHTLGWEHTFVHELYHFIDAVINDKEVSPYGATFEDGYRCAVICDAIEESSKSGKKVKISY